MTYGDPIQTVVPSTRPLASSPSEIAATTRITFYGCGQDEADLLRDVAPRFGVLPVITGAAVSEGNIELASASRCVSVGHKNQVADSALLALRRVGVEYIATRSIGCNHIDLEYAERLGITVGNVVYSPDSVADYTLMLMLMAVRHAASTIRRVDVNDYRLNNVRGRELRDLTVGVIGTGRIGAAVVGRLRGFGCHILAYDHRPKIIADYVSLNTLLQKSDVVTLHTPLNAETYHLLDRQRIDWMRQGAIVVNTGRGALLDTEALVCALERGNLGGAALDVVEGEEGVFYRDFRDKPIACDPVSRLAALPNVIVTPHTAYFTTHALADTIENTLRNCLDFERKNPEVKG